MKTKQEKNISTKTKTISTESTLFLSSKLKISIKEEDSKYKVIPVGTNKESISDEDIKKESYDTEDEAKSKAKEILYKYLNQERLKKSLQSENLLVLTGAGSSMCSNGKSMSGLWDSVSTKTPNFQDILKEIKYQKTAQKNLEDLLSNIEVENKSRKNKGDDNTKTINFIKNANEIISNECNLSLSKNAPHATFISNLIKARKKNNQRVKIFTLNYDTLFEKAADEINAVLIDGFSLSQSKEFQSTNFDLDIVQREKTRINNEENFYNKVFHLYKIHGSIDWCFDENKQNVIKINGENKNPCLIYPNSSKFEKSYEMPFFEMISRFQSSLRKENTTLFIIGYGFSDEHINRTLEEAIKNNLNLETYIVKPNIDNNEENINLKKCFTWIGNGVNDLYLIGDTFEGFSKNLPEIQVDDAEDNRIRMFKEKSNEQ